MENGCSAVEKSGVGGTDLLPLGDWPQMQHLYGEGVDPGERSLA